MKASNNDALQELSIESDLDLLEIISWKEDLDSRNQAFKEFHKRYIGFLYRLVNIICGKYPNGYEMSSVITNNVLVNVYNYSGSFKIEGKQTDLYIRSKIEAWLVGIAKQEMKSLFTNSPKKQEEELAYEKMLEASAHTNVQTTSYSEDIIKKAFALLKPRDQDILRTYWLFYEKGAGTQAKNMPSNVLEDLAKRYETTTANIRQIVSRSNKTIKEFLQKNYKPIR